METEERRLHKILERVLSNYNADLKETVLALEEQRDIAWDLAKMFAEECGVKLMEVGEYTHLWKEMERAQDELDKMDL